MKSRALRRSSLFVLSIGIGACGGDRSEPLLPTSAPVVPVTASGSSPGIPMPVMSQGTKPPGFVAIFRVDPKPDTDGIIHGVSPLTVEFDVCGSRPADDRPLSYLYDWDSDHVADVAGAGDACHQKHTYKLRQLPDAKGNVLFEANVCVVSGDPRVHGPETFFSCRTFRISLPVPSQPGSPNIHHTGYGQQWTDGVATGTHDLTQATRACAEYMLATSPGVGSCEDATSCCGTADACAFNQLGGVQRFWWYSGPLVGQTMSSPNGDPDSCFMNPVIWD